MDFNILIIEYNYEETFTRTGHCNNNCREFLAENFRDSLQQGKMARKPGKKQKENPVGCTGEGKRCC